MVYETFQIGLCQMQAQKMKLVNGHPLDLKFLVIWKIGPKHGLNPKLGFKCLCNEIGLVCVHAIAEVTEPNNHCLFSLSLE
jgi:hypothetical protein